MNENNQEIKMLKKMKKLLAVGVVLLFTLIIFNAATFTVKENEYACVKRFSKIYKIVDNAGLNFKVPFIDVVQSLPQQKMIYDLKPSDVLTSDKKALVIDTYLIWKINDPLLFIKTVGYLPEMEKRLDAATYNAIKTSIGKVTQNNIISPQSDGVDGRELLNQEILESVNKQIKDYGVSLDFIEIKKLDLPKDNEAAVFNRMISERQQMAATFVADGDFEARKIKNDTDKEVGIIISTAKSTAEKIIGDGESEYMRILSDTYSNPDKAEFYRFIKSLETLENSMTGEKTLILSKDSPLAQLFLGE